MSNDQLARGDDRATLEIDDTSGDPAELSNVLLLGEEAESIKRMAGQDDAGFFENPIRLKGTLEVVVVGSEAEERMEGANEE